MDETSRQEWESLRMDPDAAEDLGYESTELDIVSVERSDRDQRLFLPADEDALRSDAFIVADESDVADVIQNR